MPLVPDGVNLKEITNPSQGVFYKNPTHLQEAARAYEQSDIVKSVKRLGRKTVREVFTFDDKSKIKAFPGMTKIKNLTEKELIGLFRGITKYRPNITRIRIALGTDYPDVKEVFSPKVADVGSRHPRHGEDIAVDIAALFSDERLKVVDMVYQVTSALEERFHAEAHAFTSSGYSDDEYFNPVVEIEYQIIQ